jgi:hypothetical protein
MAVRVLFKDGTERTFDKANWFCRNGPSYVYEIINYEKKEKEPVYTTKLFSRKVEVSDTETINKKNVIAAIEISEVSYIEEV